MTKVQKKLYDKRWYKLNKKKKLAANKKRYHTDSMFRKKILKSCKKWALANPTKRKRANKKWYEKNKHSINERRLKYCYNLSLAQLKQMHKNQKNKCLLCERKRRLIIDHDHKTGKVRGLLCYTCNTHLGWFENTKVTQNLKTYLNIR